MTEKIKAKSLPNGRFVIVDPETGKILDDAQGYGYRTAQKAHAAWAYKHPSKKQREKHRQNKILNKTFINSHKSFLDAWADVAIDCYKNGEKPGFQDFKELVKEYDPKFPGSVYSLYYYVEHH